MVPSAQIGWDDQGGADPCVAVLGEGDAVGAQSKAEAGVFIMGGEVLAVNGVCAAFSSTFK